MQPKLGDSFQDCGQTAVSPRCGARVQGLRGRVPKKHLRDKGYAYAPVVPRRDVGVQGLRGRAPMGLPRDKDYVCAPVPSRHRVEVQGP